MSSKKMLFLITFGILLVSSATGLASAQSSLIQPRTAEEIPLSEEYILQFDETWDNSPTIEETQVAPNIGALVEEIPTFIADGLDVYVGNEIPTQTFSKYYYRLSATYIWVTYDHDTIGAGDFFLRGWVNQQIDDDMSYSEDWNFDIGELNDGEEKEINLILFEGWAHDLSFKLELYDSDSGIIDTFGTWTQYNYGAINVGNVDISYDGGDATVRYKLEYLSGPISLDAEDMLDAYKPYLYSDVETSYDDPAEYVFGRVIEGFDDFYGKTTTCLQYLYYFPYEYTGNNYFVHNFDWEMILIYLDYTSSRYPYRLVWDNGYYFSSESGYDWIDGQDYRIYEKNATPGNYYREVEFSEYLWPLIGESRTMNYQVMNLSEVWTSDMEKWGIFEWGLPTFQATIDTSYHQFDLGDAGGTDPMDMNRNYEILDMNDTMIKEIYQLLNTSWNEGIHELDGYYTPNCAPFSWDVTQPFTRPYILNNYPKVCTDINAYNGAEEKRSKSIRVDKNVTTSFQIPCLIETDIPKFVSPGELINSDLNIELDKNRANLTIDIGLLIELNVSLAFWEHQWATEIHQQIILYFGTNTLEFKGDLVNFQVGIEDYQFSDVELGSYIDIEGLIQANLIGQIANFNISISISEILKNLLDPGIVNLMELLIDDMSLQINPKIDGYIKMDLFAANNLLINDLILDTYQKTVPLSFNAPNEDLSEFKITIEDLKYGIHFETDWAIDINWAKIPGLFLDDFHFYLGTWPSFDVDLTEGTAKLQDIAKFQYNDYVDKFQLIEGLDYRSSLSTSLNDPSDPSTSTSSENSSENFESEKKIDGGPISWLLPIIGLTALVLIIMKQKSIRIQ